MVAAFSSIREAHPSLGEGIYTYADAEKILRLSQRRLRNWLQGYLRASKRRLPAGRFRTWKIGGAVGFGFETLIEAYIVARLRELGVSMTTIRLARDELSERLKTPFPFTKRGLLSDGKKILIALTEDDADDVLLKLDQSGQTEFRRLVEQFCQKIDFADSTDSAVRYWPDGRDSAVVVDPHHSFGRPSIDGTNISTETITGMLQAGESEEVVASLYELDLKQVRDAARFEFRQAA